MIEFHTIRLSDKDWMDQHVYCENSPSADYNFGNMYIWDRHYRQLVCCWGDRTLVKVRRRHHDPVFVFPIGCGELGPAIEALRAYAAEEGFPMVMRGVTEMHREQLDALYPGRFVYEEDAIYADYIYEAERLATYSGKALHGKKNHCNRFESDHDWRFVPLTREWIPACMEMLDNWVKENAERLDESIVYEHEAIELGFRHYERLKLEGGVLLEGERILGFSLGEMTCADTFNTHFEKAEPSVNGAYPMVCRELARQLLQNHPGLRYINREDDMGLESLRQSKLSYKPLYLLKKYTARWIDD